MKFFVAAAACFFALVMARADNPTPGPEVAATVVLYNLNQPESLALAKYYAGRRGIPDAQVIGLDCSKEEEISRDEYLVDIEAPLRAQFTKNGWWSIARDAAGRRYVEWSKMRFAALMRGVPMKIRSNAREPRSAIYHDILPGSPLDNLLKHNEASVDSELAAMFTLLEDAPAVVGNPYYRRFAPILSFPASASPLLVCRLDGPNDGIVRRMIDDAIATEKNGLWGWAYLDARNIHSGGYAEGDQWITNAAEMMRRRGIPVISDYAPEVWREGFPVTDAAVYYGWYEENIIGPFAKPEFRFVPGAIAVHIHSYSAHTIRDPTVAWAGPLLAHGATATMGNVYEPYLSLTVNFDVLQDRLMNGFTLAESAYAATRGISWMNVVLGDPLYKPYASWSSLESTDSHPNPWQRYREIVLKAGDPLAAADELRALAKKLGNSMPIEALGQAQASAGQFDEALKTLDEASEMEESRTIRFRLVLEQIEILRRADRGKEALKKVGSALGDFRTDEQQTTLGELTLILQPPPPPPPPSPPGGKPK
ncbi:MAG: TIGR03790 family protein [Chthoniobacterales bacterium]